MSSPVANAPAAAAEPVPLVDLKAQYRAHRGELDAALAGVLEGTAFIGGPDHKAFAEEFADWCGGGGAALVGSGTDALILAIVELLGQGDGTGEIVCPSHTFIATAEAITAAGYRPVFADIDPAGYTVTAKTLQAALTPATRALLPVHLYGQMAPMDEIAEIARSRGLKLIEDAAQAHGARWSGALPGGYGDAACFSFYPGKNLGAWGDAGAVYSRDAELTGRITMRANHGRTSKYLHEFEGVSSRLDGLQAAVLRVKLRHIDTWNAARRRAADWYEARLRGHDAIRVPATRSEAEHVFHLYVVEVEDRDRVLSALQAAKIGAGVHYPVPLHEQPAYAYLGYSPGDLPHTSRAARRILSLPLYPEITEAQVDRVCAALVGAVGGA